MVKLSDLFNQVKAIAFVFDVVTKLGDFIPFFRQLGFFQTFHQFAFLNTPKAKFWIFICSGVFLIFFSSCWVIFITYKGYKKKTKYNVVPQLFFGFTMILATTAYFIGDNLGESVIGYKCNPTLNDSKMKDCGKTISLFSTYLLIFGILGFRFIPKFEEKCSEKCKKKPNDNNEFNNSDNNNNNINVSNNDNNNDNINVNNTDNNNGNINVSNNGNNIGNNNQYLIYENSYFKTVGELFGVITEVDGWYTAMTTLSQSNYYFESTKSTDFKCSVYITVAFWIGFVTLMTVLAVYYCLHAYNYNKEYVEKECCRSNILLCFVIVLVWIVAGVYIVTDNDQPLACTYTFNPVTKKRIHISLYLLLIVLCVLIAIISATYFLVLFYEQCKEKGCCYCCKQSQNQDQVLESEYQAYDDYIPLTSNV